jgi:hypothetical protein
MAPFFLAGAETVNEGDVCPADLTSAVGESLRGGSRGDKFVAFDLGRDAEAAIFARLDPHDLPEATNVDVAVFGDLLRQRDHELDFAADREAAFRKEVQAAVTYVACLGGKNLAMRIVWEHAQG